MILEKTFEDILSKYPELIEDGLMLKGRQITKFGRRIDLLFEDKFKRELLVELKAGPIKDEHIGQILSYEGMLLSADNPNLRIMLIGTRVPPNLQKSLDHHGIAWKEISYSLLSNYIYEKQDETYMRFFDKEESVIVKNISEVNRKKLLGKANERLTEPQIELLIKRFKSSDNYKNFYEILKNKKVNEEKAKSIIQKNLGHLNYNHFKDVFELIDEPYHFIYDGKPTYGSWFGLLIKPNALTIFKEDELKINHWFNLLTDNNTALDVRFEELNNDKYRIKGLGTGFKTLMLYLLDKSKYLIWFQGQHDGLRIIHQDIEKYNGKISQYYEFIRIAKQFAFKNGFEPTELDFVLTRLPKLID